MSCLSLLEERRLQLKPGLFFKIVNTLCFSGSFAIVRGVEPLTQNNFLCSYQLLRYYSFFTYNIAHWNILDKSYISCQSHLSSFWLGTQLFSTMYCSVSYACCI